MSGAGSDAAVAPSARRLTAFGLAIDSDVPLLGDDGDPDAVAEPVRLRLIASDRAATDAGGGETVLERFWPDGSLGMRVRRLPDDGYAVDAPGHGAFEVSPAGDTVLAVGLQGPPVRWHRPLFGQVLPLAATLRGYETLHAAAAVIDGGAVAVTAVSGTGKSSLTVNLVDRGAGLLTDDVVALQACEGELIAHPGSPLANVAAEQHALLSPATRARLGPPIGADDKLTFAVGAVRARRAPLRAFVQLRRSTEVPRLTITRRPTPDPAGLLSATFLPHMTQAARAERQLEVCALLAQTVPVIRVDAPLSLPARELAAALERALD